MRPLSLLLPAFLLLLSSGALAQTSAYPKSLAGPISTVQVTASVKAMRIMSDQAQQLAATYTMSNGWRLRVVPTSRFINAAIDNENPIQLIQVAKDSFVSRDGNVTMQFNQGEWGDDMTMSYVPNQDLAQVVVISSKIAQR